MLVLFRNTSANQQPANQHNMWVALKTPNRSATVFGDDDDDDDSPPAKRQRFASSPSQDSDENGQTPLGITFKDAPAVIVHEKDPDLGIADSQEDVENEETSSKSDKQLSTNNSPAQDIKDNDKDSPERTSVSSISLDDIPVITSPKDVQTRLGTKYFTFNLREVKAIIRWMRMHRTYKISSHKTEFNELMHHLGYTSASLSQKDQNELRTKLRTKMAALHMNMKKSGAIPDDYDGYDSSGSTVFRPLPFEEWTLMWYKKGWDGSLQKPDQKKYEKIMNERDDSASSRHGGKEGDHGEAEQDGKQASEEEHVPGEEKTEAPNTLYDGEFDGTELFVVEEPSQLHEKEDRPPPKDDESAEANGWNTYLLNKEIIDAQDWNYRAMTAQHLGIDLNDLAVLYPDPFPGYEPPPRESSASPATPTRSVASSVTSTPSTPSPPHTKITDKPDCDESISLEVTDSEDEEKIPGTRAIENANDSDEDKGDDEMEEEDLAYGVDIETGHQSQASTANAGHRTTDTQVTTPAPMTPQRSISRQSRTPRSTTPSMYTAVWSPKE
ncbi:hypothetical protein DL98DRAFT_36762 [Cadophora sp. DSE1049]|nr:hypothetical protein DL98DRAFT_36762 [Cadophora sp. DSE1049]